MAYAVQLKNCQTRALSDLRLLATPHLQLSPLPSKFCLKVMAREILLGYTLTPPTPRLLRYYYMLFSVS